MKHTITSASLKNSAAFRASVRNRPEIRPPTRRMKDATHMYDDHRGNRFVVFRTAGGVTRKTSVRYGISAPSWEAACKRAQKLVLALSRHPAHRLRSFTWPR